MAKTPYKRPPTRRVGQPAEGQSVGKTIFWAAMVSVGTVVGAKLIERLIEGPRGARAEARIDELAGGMELLAGQVKGLEARTEALEVGAAAGAAAKALAPPRRRERVQGGEALARLLALPGGFEAD